MLGLHLDRKRGGTLHSDRVHRILGTMHAMGILWTEETIANRDGSTYKHQVELVKSTGTVLQTTHYFKYGFHTNPRILARVKGMGPQLAYSLNVPSVAVEVDGDVVFVRVPRECSVSDSAILYEQAWAMAPDIPQGSVLLGVDEDEHQLILDLESASNVHVAVIGMTGSGKSTLMKTIILSAEMTGVKVALFDPSGGFQPLAGHPSVWRSGMFRRAEECEWALGTLAHQLDRSDRDESAMMVVVVDEVPELVSQRPQIKEHLGRLAQAGRHAGMHLVLGAQHPLASELGSATLRNIPVRLVGRVADRAAAYNAAGRSDSGAEHLMGGGDFVALNGNTKRHFQAAMPSPELLDQWVHRYPPRLPRVPPRPTVYQALPAPTRAEDSGAGWHGGGRSPSDIPPEVIDAIQIRIKDKGTVTTYWVRQLTKTPEYGGEEYRQDKAERAIDYAKATL